jgi:hypothetical protein
MIAVERGDGWFSFWKGACELEGPCRVIHDRRLSPPCRLTNNGAPEG